MAIDDGIVAVCPKDPTHEHFSTTGHVCQEWSVDRKGNFESVLEDCLQVTANPDRDNIWACTTCGAQAIFLPQAELDRRLKEQAAQPAADESANDRAPAA